jgi:sugar phosphate isomerase/epimerase
MARFKIGVMTDSLRLPLPITESLKHVAELGAQGIQVYTVSGEMAPESMDAAKRKAFQKACADLKLEIAALCGDLGGHGFQVEQDNVAKVERSQRIVDLAVDVGAKVVTTHIGVIPEDSKSAIYQTMKRACQTLGQYAEKKGVTFAIETGPEPAVRLKRFLDDCGTRGIGVNFDPANLVMVLGEDIPAAVQTLKDHIVHTHAKDGVRHKPCDPEQVYHSFAIGGIEGLHIGDFFAEVPLGKGQVPWDAYLQSLSGIGYKGFLTIEREIGADPIKDITEAIGFLKERV